MMQRSNCSRELAKVLRGYWCIERQTFNIISPNIGRDQGEIVTDNGRRPPDAAGRTTAKQLRCLAYLDKGMGTVGLTVQINEQGP